VFTGLIEDLGALVRADRRSDALVMTVRPDGDSRRRRWAWATRSPTTACA
jgi:hypothetical protein